jgi:hypothetical protein
MGTRPPDGGRARALAIETAALPRVEGPPPP